MHIMIKGFNQEAISNGGEIMVDFNEKDMELIKKGTSALIQELGYSGFLKYISRVQVCRGKYLRAREVVYKDISTDEAAVMGSRTK